MGSQESDRSGTGNYSLEVKDFGPIARANVEFRPLTVFVGPSNTGKSYLAILVYVLHQCFGSYGFPANERRPRYPLGSFGIGRVQLNQSARASLAAWLATVRPGDSLPPLPRDVAAGVRPVLERPLGIDRNLERHALRGFGVDHWGELVRRPGKQTTARVGVQIPQGASRPPVQYEFTFGRRTTHLSGRVADESIAIEALPPEYPVQRRLEDPGFGFGRSIDVDELDLIGPEGPYILRLVVDALFASLVRRLAQSAFYLPASRTGVMHTHQAVVSALIRGATSAGLEPTLGVGRLAGVIADFLEQVIQMPPGVLTPLGARRGPLDDFAKDLEDQVLGGAVRQVRGETGYPIFSYRPQGWKDDLPLMRTSSMVSELAPVVLYVRHLVQPGNVLIIEEPEAHLHPGMQAVFARELARLVHAGVRIILTTHSEWFVEQIGNLVRLSELPEDRRADIAGADVALTSDQVGVWLFTTKKRPKGSVVEEVTLDPDTGLFPTGYDEVSEALYNESAETFNRLQESADA